MFEGFPLFWLIVPAPNCAIYVKHTIYTTAVHPQRWRAFRCEHMVMLWKSGENWYFRTLIDIQCLFLPRTRHLHIQICSVLKEHHAYRRLRPQEVQSSVGGSDRATCKKFKKWPKNLNIDRKNLVFWPTFCCFKNVRERFISPQIVFCIDFSRGKCSGSWSKFPVFSELWKFFRLFGLILGIYVLQKRIYLCIYLKYAVHTVFQCHILGQSGPKGTDCLDVQVQNNNFLGMRVYQGEIRTLPWSIFIVVCIECTMISIKAVYMICRSFEKTHRLFSMSFCALHAPLVF